MTSRSIGEVLEILQEDFSDVTVSKIRFLESEGLIDPERSKSGYRQFSAVDIERLRFILSLQRDQFLPLKVIRERLEEWTPGTEISEPDPQPDLFATESDAAPKPSVAEFLSGGSGMSLSRDELMRAAKVEPDELKELEKYRLVEPLDPDAEEPRYDEHAVEVVRHVRALKDAGLEVRHQRLFSSTIERWMDLARQLATPFEMQRNPESKALADRTVATVADSGLKLMSALLRQATSRR